jgi:hypothetical protein
MWNDLDERVASGVASVVASSLADPLGPCLAALGASLILFFLGVCLWCWTAREHRYNESLRFRLEAMIAEFDGPGGSLLAAGHWAADSMGPDCGL